MKEKNLCLWVSVGGKTSLKCWWDLPKLGVTVIYRDFPQTRLCHRKVIFLKLPAASAEEGCPIVFPPREQSSQSYQSYLEPPWWDRIITDPTRRGRAVLRVSSGKFRIGKHWPKPVFPHISWVLPLPGPSKALSLEMMHIDAQSV